MALTFKIDTTEVQKAAKLLQNADPRVRRAVRDEVEIYLNNVLYDSKTKPPKVPVDIGALQSTGHVEVKSTQKTVRGTISYGGIPSPPFTKEVDYAAVVHDDLRPKNFQRPGSGPKFVSTHLNHREPEFVEALNQVYLDALGSEGGGS